MPHDQTSGLDEHRRQSYRDRLLDVLPTHQPPQIAPLDLLDEQRKYLIRATRSTWGRISPLDETWQDWLERTGELPPDFETMPSIPFLPDPLLLDEGGANTPVTSEEQWQTKRVWIKEQYQKWVVGSWPPPPDNMRWEILDERQDGQVTLRSVMLRFGPEHKAQLRVELLIPPGDGPFPVFMTQWNHQGWALVAVRRGYLGCTYTGCDADDDTEAYADIWYPEYDFSRLMRRAWGAHRAVDYLYTLPFVDKDRIAHSGHSRNGKSSLLVAAFDERITACISEAGGTGGEAPFRYTCDKYDKEPIEEITRVYPAWFHPHLKFFVGREHKLPVDQNLLLALTAPRALMLSSSRHKRHVNPWGIEQSYASVRRVYEFLGAEEKLAIRLQGGDSARDIEDFVDFLDFVFSRGDIEPSCRTYWNYSFDAWCKLSGEQVGPGEYPEVKADASLLGAGAKRIRSAQKWEQQADEIRGQIRWALGDEPPGVTNPGPQTLTTRTEMDWDDFLSSAIPRPQATKHMGKIDIGHYPPSQPYRSFGDHLHGNLYYPVGPQGTIAKERLPAVIFLHPYDYATGFVQGHRDSNVAGFFEDLVSRGFAVFAFDLIGFGTRQEEGTLFYRRYPHWSKMGKMILDTRGAVEALSNLDIIDPGQIFAIGYALGGALALYTAALDARIAGVASVCGVTPLRPGGKDSGTEGICAYSHLHGLQPRLGFFAEQARRLPYDFGEILACIAPRPALVVAPTWDRDARIQDVEVYFQQAREVYEIYDLAEGLQLDKPQDYNRFSISSQQYVANWLQGLKR